MKDAERAEKVAGEIVAWIDKDYADPISSRDKKERESFGHDVTRFSVPLFAPADEPDKGAKVAALHDCGDPVAEAILALSEPQQSAQDHYTTDAAPGTTTPISGALNTSKFMGKELWVGGTINAAPDSVAVPREPTEEMLNAMRECIDFDRDGQNTSVLEDASQTSLIHHGVEIGPCGSTIKKDLIDAYKAALLTAASAKEPQ